MIVGIDLGTTHSLVGVIEKGRPRLFPGENGSPLVPSVVYFDGQRPVVGASAKSLATRHPDRAIWSAKRFMGKGKQDVADWIRLLPFDFSPSDDQVVRFQVGERGYTPIEISSFILRKLKAVAEDTLKQTVKKAVVTVPAYFNDSQRQATKLAGELAGLEVVRIVNEPTAASLAYGLDKKTLGVIAVFDLGGGTFDISILRVKEGVFEVLATNGDTSLGGDDLDAAIAEALSHDITKAWGKDPRSTVEGKARLTEACEALKRTLSEESQAAFAFDLDGERFERVVTREELQDWCLPIVERVIAPCRQCVTDAGVNLKDVTDVILVGGSTRMPLVRETAKRIFEREPICSLNPDEVVAMGAAVQANILAGQTSGMLLLDVTPLSLGIETMGGVTSRIIHRNSTIPVSASEKFSTFVDGQTRVAIHVVQGERELVKDNRSLARFELAGLPPLPAGVPQIEVEFILDANGILSVRAMERRTLKSASITVNPSYGLSDAEVERMLQESFDYAEADFEARFLAEAGVEGDALARAAKKSLERGKDLIDANEAARIEAAIKALEESLSGSDRHLIKGKIEELNAISRDLAEKLMNRAVQEALKDKTLSPQETTGVAKEGEET